MIKESSSFYPAQQTSLLCLISIWQLWQGLIIVTLLLGTSIITVTVLYIQKDILIHVALNIFFSLTIEMDLVDNSILFPRNGISFEMYR